ELLARRAELLHFRGRWDDAEKAANAAIAAQEGNLLAHWVLAQVQRDRGDLEKAAEQYLWFIRAYNDKEFTDPDDLLLVGLAALQRARVLHQADQFGFVLNEIFKESLKLDKNFWPGEYEAGKLFLEKHNKADAHKALDRALVINPRSADAVVGKGLLALASY